MPWPLIRQTCSAFSGLLFSLCTLPLGAVAPFPPGRRGRPNRPVLLFSQERGTGGFPRTGAGSRPPVAKLVPVPGPLLCASAVCTLPLGAAAPIPAWEAWPPKPAPLFIITRKGGRGGFRAGAGRHPPVARLVTVPGLSPCCINAVIWPRRGLWRASRHRLPDWRRSMCRRGAGYRSMYLRRCAEGRFRRIRRQR